MTTKQSSEVLRDWSKIKIIPLWPCQEKRRNPNASRRHQAILHVLQRIPSEDYEKLIDTSIYWHWHIPDWSSLSEINYFREADTCYVLRPVSEDEIPEEPVDSFWDDFMSTAVMVLYLSPMLEKSTWSVIVAHVALQLARIAIWHELEDGQVVDSISEKEAKALVDQWGFQRVKP